MQFPGRPYIVPANPARPFLPTSAESSNWNIFYSNNFAADLSLWSRSGRIWLAGRRDWQIGRQSC